MGAGPSARTSSTRPPPSEPVPGLLSRSEPRSRGGRGGPRSSAANAAAARSVVSDDMVARRVKRGYNGNLDITQENRPDIAPHHHARHLENTFDDRSVAHTNDSPVSRNQPLRSERSHDTAWLDDCITMELEASQEMVRSTRARMEEERAAKFSALEKLEAQKKVSESLQEENNHMKEGFFKLQAEMEELRQELIERTRQHDEESVRLRTELRMARRHEEFLSKELEAQRAAAGRRLKDVQGRSEQELESLRRACCEKPGADWERAAASAVTELNDKCERMAMGSSLKVISRAGRTSVLRDADGDADGDYGDIRASART